ncbi:MAG: inositol monophosphatase [Actinobacteria bacterium]|nr:inositol monophosphatase [Actinomycetota bacterium]
MGAPAVDSQLLQFAVRLAGQAGGLAAERFFAGDYRVAVKDDGTEVTEADLAVEDLVRGELLRHCPRDGIYGEEGGTVEGASGRRWIIDPINGTAYFVSGIPLFDTLLAYEDEHGPAIGVICQPVARQLVFAGRGLGCWVRSGAGDDRRPVLRAAADLRHTRVQPHNMNTWHTDLLLALHRNVTLTGYFGGVTGVLTGALDAMVIAGFPMGYEDVAPLPVVMAEAGGRVTDLSGGPVLSGPGTALVSTGGRHDELLGLVAGLPHDRPG